MLRVVRAMAGIADAITDLRTAQQRLHQAHAARLAAAALRTYTPPARNDGDDRPPQLGPTDDLWRTPTANRSRHR